MRTRVWERLLAITAVCAMLALPLPIKAGPGLHRDGQDDQERGGANTSRIYQDPAGAAGYKAGYDCGLADGRGGERYDPVRHRDYRDADRGYTASYGSKDGYKTNFRAGFRQGYEDGYREGVRSRK